MNDYYCKEKLMLEILDSVEEKEHFHQDIELLYVLDGKMTVVVEEQKTEMSAEDVLIINANKRHYLSGKQDLLYAKLSIQYELFSDILNDFSIMFVCDSTRTTYAAYDDLRHMLQKLIGRYLSGHGNTADFEYISICYHIMDYISSCFLIRTADVTGGQESDKYQLRIHQIDNYIRANYASSISIKELSEKLYLSSGYLSRFFKKNYGMSFAEYLTHVRLHHAVDQLLYTDMPITRIVYDNGFSSVTMFNRAFKKEYGETPSEVRKRVSRRDSGNIRYLSKKIEKKLENVLWTDINDQEEAESVIRASVSVRETKKLDYIWKKLINVGAAEDMLHSEVQEHIIILKEALKFESVRFWNPFSKELLIDINNPGHQYNFSRLDSILDFLTKYDILPFIELANKPKRVVKSSTDSVIYQLFESIQSIENWKILIEMFIRHIVSRYGREEVSQWKFELWYDAAHLKDDLRILAYAERFRIAQEIIHRYTDAKIGGCGMHGYSKSVEKKSGYIRDFYKKTREAGVNPDFLTMYVYAYDSQEQDGEMFHVPSQDADYIQHAVDNMIHDVGVDKEIWLSEWNLTFSDRNLINDSCFKGAYVVKNYIALTGKVNGMAYFRGTDRVSEYYDTNDVLFGGTGILTKDGVKKPTAFAFYFLNRLYSGYIGKGENYMITTDRHDNYSVICHNCRQLSYNYYHSLDSELDREHMAKYFENMDSISVNLELKDVRNGAYQVRIWQLNEENGSLQKKWQEMGYEKDLSRDDIIYFQKVCEPRLSMKKIIVTDSVLNMELIMAPNEIAFISAMYVGQEHQMQ